MGEALAEVGAIVAASGDDPVDAVIILLAAWTVPAGLPGVIDALGTLERDLGRSRAALSAPGAGLVVGVGVDTEVPEHETLVGCVDAACRVVARQVAASGISVNSVAFDRQRHGEVNPLLAFLASGRAPYLTGTLVRVDRGRTLDRMGWR